MLLLRTTTTSVFVLENFVRGELRKPLLREGFEGAGCDSSLGLTHQAPIKVQIMLRQSARREYLAGHIKMPKIAARERAARPAFAAGIERTPLARVLGPLDRDA